MQLFAWGSFLTLPSNYGLFSAVLSSLVGANDIVFVLKNNFIYLCV